MTKNKFPHTVLFLYLFFSLFSVKLNGADITISSVIHKIDSLNELAFKQKRYDVAKALNNLFVSENLAVTIDYQKGLATALLYEGGIFHQNGYDKRALSTYYKSLLLFKSLKDTFNIALVGQQIALSLEADGKTGDAIDLYNESLKVFTALKRYDYIANIQNSLGQVELDLQHLNKAEKHFKDALAICIREKYAYGEKKAYYNLGMLEEKRKNFSAAETNYRISLSKDSIMKDRYGASLNQLGLSSIFMKQHMKEASIKLAKEAYQSAGYVSAYNLLQDAAGKVVEASREMGDVKTASQWQDSLIKILQLQNENEKEYALNYIDVIKNQDVQKLNAENEVLRAKRVQKEQLLIITVGTFILIIVAVLAVLALVNYQRQRFFGMELKQKNEIIEKNSASLDQLNKEISNQNVLLESDNKTKSKLLSIISQDLRTPLVNTKGILNLVNQGMLPPEEAEQLLQQLETQYLGTTSLLDNLLFWIKGQMTGIADDRVKIGLYQLMKSLEEEHRVPLLQKKVHLKNNVDPTIFIYAEKEMIRIVCRNLISNAIKFTRENGFIELISRTDVNGVIFITVKDSGIGMTKEQIAKVNAKQYYNTTGTSYEKGSGFGLMLCRDLITKYGGELLIESEVNAGSSFTIKMPQQPLS